MKRTIFISKNNGSGEQGDVIYRGKNYGYLMSEIREHFHIEQGYKYRITIVEGTQYFFLQGKGDRTDSYDLQKVGHKGLDLTFVCKKAFDKLFFVPKRGKKYNITVKRVEWNKPA